MCFSLWFCYSIWLSITTLDVILTGNEKIVKKFTYMEMRLHFGGCSLQSTYDLIVLPPFYTAYHIHSLIWWICCIAKRTYFLSLLSFFGIGIVASKCKAQQLSYCSCLAFWTFGLMPNSASAFCWTQHHSCLCNPQLYIY